MREKEFIKNNGSTWREFEDEVSKRKSNPEKLSKLYVQITDNLSFARTNFNNRTVRFYLNTLSQNLYLTVHKNRLPGKKNLQTFWMEELPATLYHTRKQLLTSLVVFLIAVIIGVFSTYQDPDFSRTILGDNYINNTLANIEKGDPGAVYKDSDAVGMFLQITANNIYVSFLVFVLGILAGLGTVGLLISNGVMLGTFQYFFFTQGVGFESALIIWQHGTIEIASIVIAGGAGIVLGQGFIFPGSYTRVQSLKNSAQKGLKIMLGLVPMFVLAALIESFVTRQTELHTIIRLGVIILSAVLIIGYYVVKPFTLPKATLEKYRFTGVKKQYPAQPVNLETDKTQSQLLKETFSLTTSVISRQILPFLLIAAAGAGIIIAFSPEVYTHLGQSVIYSLHGLNLFLNFAEMPQHFTLFTLTTATAAFFTARAVQSKLKVNYTLKPKSYILAYLITALFACIFFISGQLQFILAVFLTPLFFHALNLLFLNRFTTKELLMPVKKPGFIFGSYLGLALLSLGILILLNQPIVGLYAGQVLKIIPVEEETAAQIGEFLLFFVQQFTFTILSALFTTYAFLAYHHQWEAHTASALIKKLQSVKSQSQT